MPADGTEGGEPCPGESAAPDARLDDETLTRTIGDAQTVRDVFEQMPNMMVGIGGPDQRFDAANAAYRTFFSRPRLVGLSVREAFAEVAGQRVYELVERVYATGKPQRGREWRFQVDVTGTGVPEEFYADFIMAPRRSADGTVSGLVVSLDDVTERVRERKAAEAHAADTEHRHRATRDVVAELQQALLPTALPALPQARVAGRYLVAAHDQAAGGDWFDAVPLADGSVALVVGDVVGHGVAASAAMGQLRAVLTELLTSEPDLATLLGRVDAFAARDPALRAATLALAVLDPATGTLRYGLAGHPPPLVVDDSGATRYLPDTGSPPLGTGSPPLMATETLAPGELVLLYSDGLIERPHRTLEQGMSELAQVSSDAATGRAMPTGAAPSPAERVCQLSVELLTRTGYADDVTTLAARRLPEPVPTFDRELRSHPASLGAVRRSLEAWLDALEPLAADRDAVALALWEAVTNAVEHAYPAGQPGTIWLHAALAPNGNVECRVTDHGAWRAPGRATTHRGRGLLLADQLVDRLTVSHHGDAGPSQDGKRPAQASGTVVQLRHRLNRPAMLASEASAQPAMPPDRPPYGVDTETRDDPPRVSVGGPIDITTSDELYRDLLGACRGGVLPLTVDLADVTHLASAGVRVLFDVRDQLAAHGQTLTVLAPAGSQARAVLDLVHLPSTEGDGALGAAAARSNRASAGNGPEPS
jgi:anti-anti-sigma factor